MHIKVAYVLVVVILHTYCYSSVVNHVCQSYLVENITQNEQRGYHGMIDYNKPADVALVTEASLTL